MSAAVDPSVVGLLSLVLAVLSGLLLLDVALQWFCSRQRIERRRQRDRDIAAMQDTIERTGGPR